MAYRNDEKFVEDILQRKEFVRNIAYNQPRTEIDVAIKRERKLNLRSYQRFAKRFMSPSTPVKRMYVKYGTGVGKTGLSIAIAREFVDIYQKNRDIDPAYEIPTIGIIGFTKNIFRRELLKWPEFGYVTRDELDRQNKLAFLAETGTVGDVENYNEFMTSLRRRLTNKRRRGFFDFFGYREFANRVIVTAADIDGLTEKEIHDGIKEGKIKINTSILDRFRHGLIICDEIHNVYNSCDKNNWGIALQIMVNYLGDDVRVLYLSATPINHSPTEIVDLANLISGKHYTKKDFMMDCEDFCNLDTSTQGAMINKISKIFDGHVLFLDDADPRYYPKSTLEGEYIKGIDILKFIRCPMPPLAEKTYLSFYEGTLAQDAQYIMDFILPNPDESSPYGLYKTQEVKLAYEEASQEWLDKNNIIIKTEYGFNVGGTFLHEKNLGNISTKYLRMLQDIKKHINTGGGKLMIYHKYVRMSGILFIKEVLAQNGFIDEYSAPADNTIDALTGLTKAECEKKGIDFYPCRFVMIHSDLEQHLRDKSIERYNALTNIDGREYMILIGADIIKESFDLNCVNMIMVMTRPDNISTLLQIFGRAKRQNSHSELPPDKRFVKYRIYVSSLSTRGNKEVLTYEEQKYSERIRDYKLIQKIEKALNERAVDTVINFGMIKNTFVEEGELGVLAFKPVHSIGKKLIEWSDIAYYNEIEIADIIYILKRIFLEVSTVLKLPDIVKLVHQPPFSLEFDPLLIDDENIYIALHKLVSEVYDMVNITQANIIDRLFDPNDKIISYYGDDYCVVKIADYFILTPIYNNQINIYTESIYRKLHKSRKLTIDMNEYITSIHNVENYELRRAKFISKYKQVLLAKPDTIDMAICEYSLEFQTAFIEEMIYAIFISIIDPASTTKEITENIEFYVKMLFYYSLFEVIIFYNSAQEYIRENYEFDCKDCKVKSAVLKAMEISLDNMLPNKGSRLLKSNNTFIDANNTTEDLNNGEMSAADKESPENDTPVKQKRVSASKTRNKWYPDDVRETIHDKIAKTIKIINSAKTNKNKIQVDGNLLPIGYSMNKVPRFFHITKGWYDAADYSRHCKTFRENDIIIGYYSKSKSGLRVSFKVRKPAHQQTNIKDTRKLEKGTNCASKSKSELIDILEKLGTKISESMSISDLCRTLNYRLINLEIAERRNPDSNLKYFYHYWECQPISD